MCTMGDCRKPSSTTDVGGPSGMSARTPPQQASPTIPTPPEVVSDEVFQEAVHVAFNLNFSVVDALFMFSGMATYVADIVTDVVVAVQYLFLQDFLWAAMTFAFVLVPSVTLQYFSLRWFILDISQEEWHKGKGLFSRLLSWAQWSLFHVFQLGAVKRYWRTLKYGWRSRDEKVAMKDRQMNYRMMVYEYRDITMLRLLEAFMESAPQLVLQLYIMKKQYDNNENIHWITGISALVSLSSLAWGLEAYHKALRESRRDKRNIGYCALSFRMAWRTFAITSRVVSMALFASVYKWIVFPMMGVHWLFMTMWLIHQGTDFCSTLVEEWLFDGVIGIVYIFSFFNMKEGRTRYRVTFYYFVVFIENTVMFALWYNSDDGIASDKWYAFPALVLVWGGFAVGLFFMTSYYCCLHPNIEYICHRERDSKGRKIQPWENRGMDEVDHGGSQHDPFEGKLFTRKGRRSLLSIQGTPVYYGPPTASSNYNHSDYVIAQPNSISNGRKQWQESQV